MSNRHQLPACTGAAVVIPHADHRARGLGLPADLPAAGTGWSVGAISGSRGERTLFGTRGQGGTALLIPHQGRPC